MKKRSLFTIALLLSVVGYSVGQDSLMQAARAGLISSGVLPFQTYLTWPGDSFTIADAHHFDLMTRQTPVVTRTGNLGGASFDPFALNGDLKLFDDGFNRFDVYLLNPLENRFMLRNKRFTNINYHLGSRKEQHIRLRHEQVISPGFVAGLDYGGMGSPGDYYSQLNKIRNFDIFALYASRSGSYSVYASYTSNKVDNQENGGITADSLFENAGSKVDTKTLPVNLKNASIRYKTRDYLLQQRFRIFSKGQTNDSASKAVNGGLFLNQSTWWQRRSHLFQSSDADSLYFDVYYNDSTATYDSSFFNDLNNRLALQYRFLSATGRFYEVTAGAAHQYTEYSSGDSLAFYNTSAVVAGLKSSGENWTAAADLNTSVSGEHSGTWLLQLYGFYKPDSSSWIVGASARIGVIPHSAFEQFYRANHFSWNRTDAEEEQQDLKIHFAIPKRRFTAELEYLHKNNFIYYGDSSYVPQLQSDGVGLLAARFQYTFNWYRFGFPLQVILQNTSDKKTLPVMPYLFRTGFYYKNKFFKQALSFTSGIDVTMAGESKLHGYNPGAASFYVQDQKTTGAYPYIDWYVNMGIGSAILFIKIEHVNAGFSSRDYWAAYHYPMTGRAFKFGVVWNFED